MQFTNVSLNDIIPLRESTRSMTDEGFLNITASVATFDTVQVYKAFELGDAISDALGKNRQDDIRIYRPPKEVLDKDSLKSYRGKSVTIDHPDDPVGKDNHRQFEAGVMLSDGRQSSRFPGMIEVDMILKDQDAIDRVNKTELSLGYSANYQLSDKPDYDLSLSDLRINHVSLVHQGRATQTRFHDDQSINPQKVKSMTVTKVRLHLSDEEFIDSEFTDRDQASHVRASIKWSKEELKLKDQDIDALKTGIDELRKEKDSLRDAIKSLEDSLPVKLAELATLAEKGRTMTGNEMTFDDAFSKEAIMAKTLEHLQVKLDDGDDLETLFNYIFKNPLNEKAEKVMQKDTDQPIPSTDNLYYPKHGGFFR